MTIYNLLIAPFADFGFMKRALIACLALSLGSGPIGIFLVLRRMSLMGDAMSHAILPGAAIGFLIAGYSLWAMSIGGLVVGLAVVVLAGLVSRNTILKEDASLAGFYLMSLAAGVLIVSKRGSNVDLLHVLFGTILAVDTPRSEDWRSQGDGRVTPDESQGKPTSFRPNAGRPPPLDAPDVNVRHSAVTGRLVDRPRE